MRTISSLCRRVVAAAFAVVLLVFLVNAALLGGVILSYGLRSQQQGTLPLRSFSDRFMPGEDGLPVPEPGAVEECLGGCAFAMLLDPGGSVLWRWQLPASLDHPYTVGQVAALSRWYLDDYPVFVYRNDFGLLVLGMPPGSITRFNFYMDSDMLGTLISGFVPLLLLDAALILAVCLFLGWRAARSLRAIGQGIDALARGGDVRLPERGATADLARQLNRAGALIAAQKAEIARRDAARTDWIAGVSHDIRTPLAVILSGAEALEREAALPDAQRRLAQQMRAQAERIRALIGDLNLTSRLQYDAQPLRLAPVQAGALLREAVAAFVDSPSGEACDVSLELDGAAGQLVLMADAALLRRAIDNLLYNSARHNPPGCAVFVRAQRVLRGGREALRIVVGDDGAGYPPDVLAVLRGESIPCPPHILGLGLVVQILRAHGGEARFQNAQGARAELICPAASPSPEGSP